MWWSTELLEQCIFLISTLVLGWPGPAAGHSPSHSPAPPPQEIRGRKWSEKAHGWTYRGDRLPVAIVGKTGLTWGKLMCCEIKVGLESKKQRQIKLMPSAQWHLFSQAQIHNFVPPLPSSTGRGWEGVWRSMLAPISCSFLFISPLLQHGSFPQAVGVFTVYSSPRAAPPAQGLLLGGSPRAVGNTYFTMASPLAAAFLLLS